jgi:flagellar basal-body rod protein FlgF
MARGLRDDPGQPPPREPALENPTYLILSRLAQSTHAIDILANNIANASSPGFKAAHLGFAAYLQPGGSGVASSAPGATQTLTFPVDAGTWSATTPGTITQTGNSFDLAITASGYFQVRTASGIALTRDGAFGLLPSGTLATASGQAVLDASGQPISIPANAGHVSIAADGTISSSLAGQIGQIGVVNVADPTTLRPAGGNSFTTTATTSPVALPGLVQGALEQSNVQPIEAVTQMMRTSQNFQFATQFAQAEQTRALSAISDILGPATS